MASTSRHAEPVTQPERPARQSAVVEAQELARFLTEPWLWLLVVGMVLCGNLAYLAPYDFTLDIGGSPKGCGADALFDRPYILGFNADPEFDGPAGFCATRTVAYRWAFEDATLGLPGIGRAAYSVDLRLTSGQPSGQTALSGFSVNNVPALGLPVRPQSRSYHLLAPPSASSDLELNFRTTPYQPPGDPRSLAFAVDRVRVASLGSAAPDWKQLATLGAIVGLGYLMARRWSFAARLATAGAVVGIAAFVALLMWERQGLTLFSRQMLWLMVSAYGLTVALEPLAERAGRSLRIRSSPAEPRMVVALVIVAWLIRVLGLFHPQTFSSDVGLHMNNLLGVTRGEIIFTEGLPAEAGGGVAPYPPAQYIMLAPWQLLGLERRTLVTAANALIDSLTIIWMWLALRVVGAPAGAAYAAGALYLFATPLLRSLSTGEMANVWGQALLMPWLLAVLLWRQRRVGPVVLGMTTAVALLGHSGVFLSLGLLLATLGMLWLVRRDQNIWQFALVVGLAVVGVIAGYYLSFLEVIEQRAAAVPSTTTPLQRLGFEARELVVVSGQIGLLLSVIGIAGTALAWRKWRQLGEVLLAWWLSSLLSWATLLVSQQALRWEAFLFPALALGGGLVLAELWRRRSLLQWLAVAFISAAVAQGGVLWVQRLITYR